MSFQTLTQNQGTMYAHFSEMKKREKSSEGHKLSMRNRQKKMKDEYVGYTGKSTTDYNFPEFTEEKRRELKIKMKKQKRAELIKTVVVLLIIIAISLALINYIF